MRQSGPAPKPTSLKKLHGTYRPDRAPESEASPDPASPYQLKAPEWLSERATQKWDELALRLHGLGLLTEIDLDVFAMYCHTWDRWRSSEEQVEKHGAITVAQSGYEAVSPHVTRAKNHLAELMKLSGLLGLSPSARSRVEAVPQTAQRDELLA
jgi:P27 family predicted phage terminase small subunit